MALASSENSQLMVIDLQPKFGINIRDFESVLEKATFLSSVARLLNIPILYTEQYPERMGGTESVLLEVLQKAGARGFGKMEFSSFANESVQRESKSMRRSQVVICGIETHICVLQTAIQMAETAHTVFVCEDAVAASCQKRTENALARMAHCGIHLVHSESIVYEWMRTAGHPKFREILKLVKTQQG